MDKRPREEESKGGTDGAPARKRRSRFSDAPDVAAAAAAFPTAAADGTGQAEMSEASRKVNEQLRLINERISAEDSASGLAVKPAEPKPAPTAPTSSVPLSMSDRMALLSAKMGRALGKSVEKKDTSQLKAPSEMDFASIPVKPVTSLTVNQNRLREDRLKRAMKVEKADLIETDPDKNKYFDPRLKPASATRAPRSSFRFVEQGTYIAKAEKIRERAELDKIQEELRRREKQFSTTPQALLLQGDEADDIPEVEWWDVPFLTGETYRELEADGADAVRLDRVTKYVHHPVPVRVPDEGDLPAIPLMMTKAERKRLRHQKRMEAEKERQQQVQMGLIPPPPPKVKLSNMMRVVATQASQDPTKVEAEVRRQVEERQRAHEARNEARKPTKEEKAAKVKEKADRDKEAGVCACVFRVQDLSNPQHRFKVNINAEQNHLTGCAIYNDDCNVVVAEGGRKALNRFKKLMLRRIDWGEAVPEGGDGANADGITNGTGRDDEMLGEQRKENRCVLVWEGQVSRAAFKRFMATPIPTQEDARKVFRTRRVEHYWDTALGFPMKDESLGQRDIE